VPSRSSCSRAKSLLGDQPGNSRPHANRACRHQHHTQGFATSSSATHLAAILSHCHDRGTGSCSYRLHDKCVPQPPETGDFSPGLSKALPRCACAPQLHPPPSSGPQHQGLASSGRIAERQGPWRKPKNVNHRAVHLSKRQRRLHCRLHCRALRCQ